MWWRILNCIKCGVELDSNNWYPHKMKRNERICKKCVQKANKIYQYSEKGVVAFRASDKKYKQSSHGKIKIVKYCQSDMKRKVQKKADKKFHQSEKGKMADKKNKAKRKRSLGWILMFSNPFSDSTPVDYHHITNAYVIAVPKDLHLLYYGKYHREKVMDIVKQIYL